MRYLFFLLLTSMLSYANAQNICFKVFDSIAQTPLPLVTIFKDSLPISVGNEFGFVCVLKEKEKIKVVYTGFYEKTILLDTLTNNSIVYLVPSYNLIDEVTVSNKKNNKYTSFPSQKSWLSVSLKKNFTIGAVVENEYSYKKTTTLSSLLVKLSNHDNVVNNVKIRFNIYNYANLTVGQKLNKTEIIFEATKVDIDQKIIEIPVYEPIIFSEKQYLITLECFSKTNDVGLRYYFPKRNQTTLFLNNGNWDVFDVRNNLKYSPIYSSLLKKQAPAICIGFILQ